MPSKVDHIWIGRMERVHVSQVLAPGVTQIRIQILSDGDDRFPLKEVKICRVCHVQVFVRVMMSAGTMIDAYRLKSGQVVFEDPGCSPSIMHLAQRLINERK